ncbi:hypothetical protein ACFO1B_56500 [Dactylosporangium siamense]|uniref:HEAT repeat domain-containing protein n=1 Tax=Dactylosporangium siamense TaxID=685454 RepID=A0A919U7H4_9ACTN|nr:hypothetical protein [Dactylosporangium siamense]GIG44592.1 hypothetical protein Dsi01nite_026330 [Dactylosporangium siamense]
MRGLPSQYRPKPYRKDAFVHVHWCCAALMTAASALITVVEPAFWSVFGLVFFGLSLALAEATRRQRLDDKVRNRLDPFLGRLRRGDVDGYGWLLRVLATMDGRTPRARRRSRVALAAITADERLLDGLLVHCRRHQLSVAVFAERLGRRGTAGLTPVLASLHPDGHARQAAVTAIGPRLHPAHLPFLVERAVDWVPEVRAAAHQVLRTGLGRRPDLELPAGRAYARVARRKHAPALSQLIDGAGLKVR